VKKKKKEKKLKYQTLGWTLRNNTQSKSQEPAAVSLAGSDFVHTPSQAIRCRASQA